MSGWSFAFVFRPCLVMSVGVSMVSCNTALSGLAKGPQMTQKDH